MRIFVQLMMWLFIITACATLTVSALAMLLAQWSVAETFFKTSFWMSGIALLMMLIDIVFCSE